MTETAVSTIVCGVDASPASRSAAELGAQLGKKLGCECVLLHVERPRHGPGRTPAPIAQARERGRLHALAEAHPFSAGARVEIAEGDPGPEIVRAAKAHAAEALIVGSHGSRSGNGLGGVPATLIRHAPCPVVVVPPGVRRGPVRRRGAYTVICPVRTTTPRMKALRLSADLAARLGAHLHVVRVSPDDSLLTVAEELGADMLVIPDSDVHDGEAPWLASEACCPTVVLPSTAGSAGDREG